MAPLTLTTEEAKAFADKLETFGDSLSDKERTLLGVILTRAAGPDDDDVEGHDLSAIPISDVSVAFQHISYLIHSGHVMIQDVHHHSHALVHSIFGLSKTIHEIGVHVPGVHDPGVHIPGVHDPGVHVTGAHDPGVHIPGVHTPSVHTID